MAVGLSVAGAGGLAADKSNYDQAHDFSVIGNGTPTVVQVHDPSCPTCRRLKRNVADVKGRFGDRLQFRITGLSTREGRQLAGEHDVGKVTLLLFNGDGERGCIH